MGRKTNEQLIYDLAKNSTSSEGEGYDDEEEQATTAAETATPPPVGPIPPTTPAPAPQAPEAGQSGGLPASALKPDPSPWANPNSWKAKDPRMKWGPEQDRTLLIFGHLRTLRNREHGKIAASFGVGAKDRAISNRLTKLRAEVRQLLADAGIYIEGQSMARPTEAEEIQQDEEASQTPINWTPIADRLILLFTYGRVHGRVPPEEYGRMALRFAQRPTRREIAERIAQLSEESIRELRPAGIITPAGSPQSPGEVLNEGVKDDATKGHKGGKKPVSPHAPPAPPTSPGPAAPAPSVFGLRPIGDTNVNLPTAEEMMRIARGEDQERGRKRKAEEMEKGEKGKKSGDQGGNQGGVGS